VPPPGRIRTPGDGAVDGAARPGGARLGVATPAAELQEILRGSAAVDDPAKPRQR